MADIGSAEQRFEELFGPGEAPRAIRAPGRTNLIGEHVDYQEGLVLPLAVEQAVRVWYRPRGGRRLRVHAATFGETRELDLGRPPGRTGTWLDYPAGVAWALAERGVRLAGMDVLVESDLPIGAGLSSSAAVEVGFALALTEAVGVELERGELAGLCRRAENEFVGVGCGIMDQYASLFGRADHALLLDCRTLECRHVPLPSGRVRVVLADTGVPRSLSASAFNRRLAECAAAVERLRRFKPGIATLRDVPLDLVEARFADLPEPLGRRARHVVSEIERVRRAASALEEGNFSETGRLLLDSHRSLRDDYEVSSAELDALVESALEQEGVYGARLTGAGFGGCTVNLVEPGALEHFSRGVAESYLRRTGRRARIYLTRPADGAGPCPGGGHAPE